jgi:hypothetical protein
MLGGLSFASIIRDPLLNDDHHLRVEMPSSADEEACGKLWEVYVEEAQCHDEGLVKSWKEDMDITLVFVLHFHSFWYSNSI